MAHVQLPKGNRAVSVVFFTIFAAFILFFMFIVAQIGRPEMRYAAWMPADAELVKTDNTINTLRYAYAWQGKTYHGEYQAEDTESKTRRTFALNGAKLTCRVNPEVPWKSVLFWSQSVKTVLFMVGFMVMFSSAFFGFVCVFLAPKKRIAPWFTGFALLHVAYALFIYQTLSGTPADSFAAQDTLAKGVVLLPALALFVISLFFLFARRRIKGEWLWALFPVPFFLIGAGVAWSCQTGVGKVEKRLAWVEAPAKILDHDMDYHRSSRKNHGTTFHATGVYSYTFDGKEYVGDSVDGTTASDNIGSYQGDVARIMRNARESGVPLMARVNPANPSEAVLFNWVRPEMAAFDALFIYSFLTVGAMLLLHFIRTFWREARAEETGAEWIDLRPLAVLITVIGLADTLFFAWLLSRMMALPPEAVYGGAVPPWGKLLILPGVVFMAAGVIWMRRVWPRRRVDFERAAGDFVAGSFVFPGMPGEFSEAFIGLEARVQEQNGRNSRSVVVWEEEQRENRLVCDGATYRVDFAFENPGKEAKGLQWVLTLTLNHHSGTAERYRFQVVPEAWRGRHG